MGRFRTGKRRQKRTKAVLPVRIRVEGDPSSHPAYTLDFSDHGVSSAVSAVRWKLEAESKLPVVTSEHVSE